MSHKRVITQLSAYLVNVLKYRYKMLLFTIAHACFQARDMDISNIESFYNSALFAKHGFVLDIEKRQIQLQES